MRIAVAGFQHETNTFSTEAADLQAFLRADSWPGLLRGVEVVRETRGLNLPIAGAIAQAKGRAKIVPILWAAAEPSGPVTREAFDALSGEIVDGIASAGPLDGIYLDLHGAMVSDEERDGESALLARLRQRIGREVPVAISLDLHANIAPGLVADCDAVAIFRSYPHLDMAATGARAMDRLLSMIATGARPAKACRFRPLLIPLHAQHTGTGSAAGALYAAAADMCDPGEHVELSLGFTAADTPHTGLAIVAQAPSATRADGLASRMAAQVDRWRDRFDSRLATPGDAVRRAMEQPGPVVLADVQDNPGAGGSGATTGLLHALIEAGARDAILGVIADPDAARAAHDCGIGAVIDMTVGGDSGSDPVGGRWRVSGLSDGRIAYTGAMYGGGLAEIGPSCRLTTADGRAGIDVIVSTDRTQCLDRAFFTHFGLAPERSRIVCVKSTAHFRADFDGMAREVICVDAQGLVSCAPDLARYHHLAPGAEVV